ncbi:hypothetical protein ACP70R_043781 [Stipagrostis hirtigluma subsp. patula]
MPPPDHDDPGHQLLEMGGLLAMIAMDPDEPIVKIWRLHNYSSRVWVQDCNIPLPFNVLENYINDYERFGDPLVYVVGNEGEVLVECPDHLLQFDASGSLLGCYPGGQLALYHFTPSVESYAFLE